MGIDWSKAAKLEAIKDICTESPHIGRIIDVLDAECQAGGRWVPPLTVFGLTRLGIELRSLGCKAGTLPLGQ